MFFFDKKMLEEAAEKCAVDLKEENIEYIKMNFNYDHFGYGFYLRNNYSQNFGGGILHDMLSAEIYAFILTKLFEPLKNKPEESYILSWSSKFEDMCAHYYKQNNKMPFDDFAVDWKVGENYEENKEAVDKYVLKICDSMWNYSQFVKNAESAVSREKCLEFYEYCKKMIDKKGIFIPLELLYSAENKSCNRQIKNMVRIHMSVFFRKHRDKANLLTPDVFNNRKFVEFAVRQNGKVLEFAKKFKNDREIVLYAVKNYPPAIKFASKELKNDMDTVKSVAANSKFYLIFDLPCMKKYNDDNEIVKLALTANGANICYASKRLRDDYNMAECALKNQKEIYPKSVYKSLSKRLRENKTLAMIEAQSQLPDVESFPAKFKDDDEIAAALSRNEEANFLLRFMSERIQKEYGV